MSDVDEIEDAPSPADTKTETFKPADRIAELNEIDKVYTLTASWLQRAQN